MNRFSPFMSLIIIFACLHIPISTKFDKPEQFSRFGITEELSNYEPPEDPGRGGNSGSLR